MGRKEREREERKRTQEVKQIDKKAVKGIAIYV